MVSNQICKIRVWSHHQWWQVGQLNQLITKGYKSFQWKHKSFDSTIRGDTNGSTYADASRCCLGFVIPSASLPHDLWHQSPVGTRHQRDLMIELTDRRQQWQTCDSPEDAIEMVTWKGGRKNPLTFFWVHWARSQLAKLQTWFPFKKFHAWGSIQDVGQMARICQTSEIDSTTSPTSPTSHSLHRVTYTGRSCTSTLLRCTTGRTGCAVLTNQVFFETTPYASSYIPMN